MMDSLESWPVLLGTFKGIKLAVRRSPIES